MGRLVGGVWKEEAELGRASDKKPGAFERPAAQFRTWITSDSEAFRAEPDRYHLYASYACPWAHRALITRAVRGLEDVIGVTIVDPKMSEEGWSFGGEGDDDPLFGATYLRELYLRAEPEYSGRVTVPVLWDKKTCTIVNNESRDVMRILDTEFDEFAKNPRSLVPSKLKHEVDLTLDALYGAYNNGVYRAGFATRQEAYEEACRDVFATLDRYEARLTDQRFMCGDVMTEADVAMFTTSLRFDLVYHAHFKLNVRRLRDYHHVWAFVRDMYQTPAVKRTCRLDHIKTHYYWSQTSVNPSRIVPLGPEIDFDAPHGRDVRLWRRHAAA